MIALNMMSQVDEHGHKMAIMDGIVDHRTDGSETLHKDRCIQKGSNKHLRKTTKGWELCVRWKDGSTSWERLAELKEAYPVQVAEHAKARGIDAMPAFAWWSPCVLRKRDRIIAAVNKRCFKRRLICPC